MKNKNLMYIIVFVIIIIIILATLNTIEFSKESSAPPEVAPEVTGPPAVNWQAPFVFNKEGYEPGIACDSTGALYYTAHKNLDDKSSWDYLASWFFVSTDNGASWKSPEEPFPQGLYWQTFVGDEGDIAVDAKDNVYFVDTYLFDNHIHVWSNQGQYEYSVRIQKTTGLDDRPWIAAQGNAIVHYLGNNAVEVNGGRYWYYRSTNGARTFTAGDPVPGNGWGLIDAERYGNHVYIISETDVGREADIVVYVSDDQGVSWDWNNPVVIAHRDGPGRQYPVISHGEDGLVFALWNWNPDNGTEEGNHVYVGRSTDYGQSWDTWEITPFKGFFDYNTINTGPDGSVAVAFYATDRLPIDSQSEWYLYGAMLEDGREGNLTFNFTIADPTPCYVGDNLHALHDFFEIVITPDKALNIGYQYYIGPENGHSDMYFVRGSLGNETAPEDE
ncbi:MAG: exo-alpha-sialidase [Thermoplasmata archaeon]|nr:MAG: exo-alpha-sialidase [Thermoplasmata archaeon]